MNEKVTIKNYTNAEYKKVLSFDTYQAIIEGAVEQIKILYENEKYGSVNYIINNALVAGCTNINLKDATLEERWELFTQTDVLEKIRESIGIKIYDEILCQIDKALTYALSTNPETKNLMKELTSLLAKWSKQDTISEEGIAEMKSLTETFKSLNITAKNEDKN